jgi:hypothetical protein
MFADESTLRPIVQRPASRVYERMLHGRGDFIKDAKTPVAPAALLAC